MERKIAIEYPESLASSLKMETKEFISEMKTVSLMKLYELGRISSGRAADLLKLDRLAFLDLLSKYGVSSFPKGAEDDLEDDLKNA